MSKLIQRNHTHLTLKDRQYIEEALNNRQIRISKRERFDCKERIESR